MSDTKTRLGGLLLVALGFFLVYLTVYRPITAARNHEGDVSLNLKGAAFAPTGIILGGVVVALGKRARDVLSYPSEGKRKLTNPGWITVGICLLVGLALYFWTKSVIEGYGYQFS